MSEPVVESFLGSLFEANELASEGLDVKLDIGDGDGDGDNDGKGFLNEISSVIDSIPSKAYYLIGAVIVLLIIVGLYLYNRKNNNNTPYQPHTAFYEQDLHPYHHPQNGEENFRRDLHQSANELPPIVEMGTSAPVPAFDPSKLIDIEKELTYSYAQLQKTLEDKQSEPEALDNWKDTISNLFQQLKAEVTRLSDPSTTSLTPEIKQHLQNGLRDAEFILSDATQKVNERKRINQQPETDQGSDVMKNMHFMGYGNKIKHFSAKQVL